MNKSKPLSILMSASLGLFWLTSAIAVPILFRPYYYWQAELLKLSERTGYTTETIREAYNDVMDYLVFGGEFGTGSLKWSESGMSHFADCKGLFRLDFIVLALSVISLFVIALLYYRAGIRYGAASALHDKSETHLGIQFLHNFCGFTPAMWTAMVTTAVFTILGIWAVIDFSSLFTAFHTVCFPGKTNWIFDYRTDQIIRILPEEFWARTGALVLIITLGGMWITAIISELIHKKSGH